jgi:Zn-dependent protease with chaperone function
MDFFAQQDLARRNTRLLVVFFLLAVAVLIVLTNVLVAGFLFLSGDYNIYSGNRTGMSGFLNYFNWTRFGTIGLAITGTIALVVIATRIRLAAGGKAVAEGMGGVRILPQTVNAAERRCLNVVEEIALAANMPVPPVYVLNTERGINAFAAGTSPANAVVGVTRGTIEHLKRHELQGVIAHEFSHILNGDMRLNIHLASLLKGITFVGDVGGFMLHSGRRMRTGRSTGKGDAALPLLGLALWLLGLAGGLAAGFIKAAISRQKEYLADASAVQFTRSSESIADALKVIGGYIPGTLVHAARATEMSHIFFGQITHRLWQVFATHPPLDARIQRVDPHWDGQYIQRKLAHYDWQPPRGRNGDGGDISAAEVGVGRAALVAAAMAGALAQDTDQAGGEDADFQTDPASLEQDTASAEDIPLVFVQHSHEPLGAQALVFALLMSDDPEVRETQLGIIADARVTGLETLVHTLQPGVKELGAPRRLPLLEICLPALKSMSASQYRLFKHILLRLIRADRNTELHEWCLYQLLQHYLDPEFLPVKPSRARYRSLQQVISPIQMVLSLLSYESQGSPADAFRRGAEELDLPDLVLLPQEQCSVDAFSAAVHVLADCYPLLKPRLLKAMSAAASNDGTLSANEWEIIASTAAVMDCPVPFKSAPPTPGTTRR